MDITITRTDPAGNIPDGYNAIISKTLHTAWDTVFSELRGYGVPISDEHETQFRANTETQFVWREFINLGCAAYDCNVHYDIQTTQ